jgi:hypothetical protein
MAEFLMTMGDGVFNACGVPVETGACGLEHSQKAAGERKAPSDHIRTSNTFPRAIRFGHMQKTWFVFFIKHG